MLGEGKAADLTGATEGNAIEELQGGVHLAEAGVGQLFDFDLVKQKSADFGDAELFRRTHVEGGELTAVQQVVTDGGRTDAFEFEVLFHPIAELTHGGSPW